MLSTPALHIIQNYLELPFDNKHVCCPYYINKKNKIHGALRALVGKGTPEDIVEEAHMYALKEKIDLDELSSTDIRKFLVDHCLGVDCSALVYYVLDAELQNNKKIPLHKKIFFPTSHNFFKKIIIKLRPAENANVLTFAHPKNSYPIPLSEVKTGDVIIITNAGPTHTYQHIVVIHHVDYDAASSPTTIHYTHSIQLRTEDWNTHGVRQGKIILQNLSKPLSDQLWEERGKSGLENPFYQYAQTAQTISLHRVHCLN